MSQLTETNFKNHSNVETCVCNECSCGRHLCKFTNNIKPDLTKNTIYKKDFLKKQMVQPKVIISPDTEKLKGPHLDMNSTQRTSFIDKVPQVVEKPRPEDLLHMKGPVLNMTTYKTTFPGYKGSNQYVRHTDQHIR